MPNRDRWWPCLLETQTIAGRAPSAAVGGPGLGGLGGGPGGEVPALTPHALPSASAMPSGGKSVRHSAGMSPSVQWPLAQPGVAPKRMPARLKWSLRDLGRGPGSAPGQKRSQHYSKSFEEQGGSAHGTRTAVARTIRASTAGCSQRLLQRQLLCLSVRGNGAPYGQHAGRCHGSQHHSRQVEPRLQQRLPKGLLAASRSVRPRAPLFSMSAYRLRLVGGLPQRRT